MNVICCTIMERGLYETTEEPSFSWRGCDCCRERTGKQLGNTVYDAKGYLNFEDAKINNYYEFKVCGGCLCTYANGDNFPEEV